MISVLDHSSILDTEGRAQCRKRTDEIRKHTPKLYAGSLTNRISMAISYSLLMILRALYGAVVGDGWIGIHIF
jgi:hypothetical protein